MTSGAFLVLVFLLALGGLSVATLVIAVRGGRGPADPPPSRPHTDPAGFPVVPAPRGALHRRPAQPRRAAAASRATAASAAAVVQTARESRTARRMSPRTGG